jgi:hypothetical protein
MHAAFSLVASDSPKLRVAVPADRSEGHSHMRRAATLVANPLQRAHLVLTRAV